MNDILKNALAYKNQTGKFMFLISLLVGLGIITTGYLFIRYFDNLLGSQNVLILGVLLIIAVVYGKKL